MGRRKSTRKTRRKKQGAERDSPQVTVIVVPIPYPETSLADFQPYRELVSEIKLKPRDSQSWVKKVAG